MVFDHNTFPEQDDESQEILFVDPANMQLLPAQNNPQFLI
jgi:hypothetical protein